MKCLKNIIIPPLGLVGKYFLNKLAHGLNYWIKYFSYVNFYIQGNVYGILCVSLHWLARIVEGLS